MADPYRSRTWSCASVMSGAASLTLSVSFLAPDGRGRDLSSLAPLEHVEEPARFRAARHDRPHVDDAAAFDDVIRVEVVDGERRVVAEDLDRVADRERAVGFRLEDRVLLVEAIDGERG